MNAEQQPLTLEQARDKYARLENEQAHYDVYGYRIIANILREASDTQQAHAKLLWLYRSHFPNDRLAIGYRQALDDLEGVSTEA